MQVYLISHFNIRRDERFRANARPPASRRFVQFTVLPSQALGLVSPSHQGPAAVIDSLLPLRDADRSGRWRSRAENVTND